MPFLFQKGFIIRFQAFIFGKKHIPPHLYDLHMLFIELSWRSLWILSDVDSNRAWKLSTPSHPYESYSRIPWSMGMLWEVEMGKGSYYRESLEKSLKIICWIFWRWRRRRRQQQQLQHPERHRKKRNTPTSRRQNVNAKRLVTQCNNPRDHHLDERVLHLNSRWVQNRGGSPSLNPKSLTFHEKLVVV